MATKATIIPQNNRSFHGFLFPTFDFDQVEKIYTAKKGKKKGVRMQGASQVFPAYKQTSVKFPSFASTTLW